MGMAAEFKDAKISVNSLWPRTIIATDALRAVGGMSLANAARTPAIMAEAAFHILGTPREKPPESAFWTRTFFELGEWRTLPSILSFPVQL